MNRPTAIYDPQDNDDEDEEDDEDSNLQPAPYNDLDYYLTPDDKNSPGSPSDETLSDRK